MMGCKCDEGNDNRESERFGICSRERFFNFAVEKFEKLKKI